MSWTVHLDSCKTWSNCSWLWAWPSFRACWWLSFPSCLNILSSAPTLRLLSPTAQLHREKGIPIPLSWKRGSVPASFQQRKQFRLLLSSSQTPLFCFPTGRSLEYWLRTIELRLSEQRFDKRQFIKTVFVISVSPETLFQEKELEPLNTKGGNPAKHLLGHLSFHVQQPRTCCVQRTSAEVQLWLLSEVRLPGSHPPPVKKGCCPGTIQMHHTACYRTHTSSSPRDDFSFHGHGQLTVFASYR